MKRPNNTDIILIVLLAVISIVCIMTRSLNKYMIVLIPYGLLLFFLPGYSILTALFTKKIALSTKILVGILISMVITFILISTINYTKTPFTYRLLIIAVITLLLAAVGYIRRAIASRKPDRYVICEDCNGYYKLEEGESLEDFEACRCGGKLKYAEDNFMSKEKPKRKKNSHERKKSKKTKTGEPHYIVCDKCGGHYTLKEGESLEDFESCHCGGSLKYAEKYFKLSSKGKSKKFSNSFLLAIILALSAVIAVIFNSISSSIARPVMVLPLLFFLSGYSIINIVSPKLSRFKFIVSSFVLSTGITFLLCLIFSSVVKVSPAKSIIILACFTIVLTIISPIIIPKSKEGAKKEPERKKAPKRPNLGFTLLKSITVRNKEPALNNKKFELPKSSQTTLQDERFNVNFKYYFNRAVESFSNEFKKDKILSIVLAVSIVLAISATAYVVLVPKEGEKFTEFYILGPDGKASNYPTNLTAGKTGNVTVGIVNHEYSTVNYEMIIKLNNQTINDTNITLSNNETYQQPFTFTPHTYGQNQELKFELYKLPDNNTVYRSLHLWINTG